MPKPSQGELKSIEHVRGLVTVFPLYLKQPYLAGQTFLKIEFLGEGQIPKKQKNRASGLQPRQVDRAFPQCLIFAFKGDFRGNRYVLYD